MSINASIIIVVVFNVFFFVFKQKTAYEMRISDWSSDVCSSDLPGSEEWGTTETTHFKSPQRRREYLKTLIESGQGNFQVNWLPGSPTDELISDAHQSPDVREFKIVVPATSGTWGITGEVLVLSR